MTLLATIPNHQIHLYCACGHRGQVEVRDLLERGLRDWSVQNVRDRSRCSHCGARRITQISITFAGQSGQALRGAATERRDPPSET